MKIPFVGSEALVACAVNRHQLRTRYRALFPDVYVPRSAKPSLRERITAAWLWSHRQATIAGLAAAALHGTKWIDADTRVELVHTNARTPAGILVRRDALLDDEVMMIDGRAVTTPERTAFDLGRRGKLRSAVARLDALARATDFKVADVLAIAERHPGVRGLRQLETALDLMDAGAQSPKETWVRLVLIEAGFPRPQTQIPVFGPDGCPIYYLDMGWAELMLAVEYEGRDHQTDRPRYVRDIKRLEYVERERGWTMVRIVAEDRDRDVIERVGRAYAIQTSVVR